MLDQIKDWLAQTFMEDIPVEERRHSKRKNSHRDRDSRHRTHRGELHAPSSYYVPKPAKILLAQSNRKALIRLIWQETSMSSDSFALLYAAPLSRFAALIQEFPASEHHHHAYPGGMLDHSLEVCYQALKLRQSHLLPPGSQPEDQARQSEAWSAACAYCGLLHDLGKIAVDIAVELKDGKPWHPWQGILSQPYRFRYLPGRDPELHEAFNGLMCFQILGGEILNWLSGFPELWSDFIYFIAGNYEKAGVLSEIAVKADMTSTALNVGGAPERIIDAPVQSQQKQWLLGIRDLVKTAEDQKLINVRGQPFWIAQDALWMVSASVMNSLRAHLLKSGIAAPDNNITLLNELQSYGLIIPNAEGKAIWRIRLSEGNWSADLTCLKVKPSLIWGGNPIPSPYKGSLEIVSGDAPAGNEGEGAVAASNSSGTEKAAPSPRPDTTSVAKPAMKPEDETGRSAEAILNMFGGLMQKKEESAAAAQVSEIKTPSSAPAPSKPDKPRKAKPPLKPQDEFEAEERIEMGREFVDWLKKGLADTSLNYNDTNAKIHIVDQAVFLVTPGIFQKFCLETTGQRDSWKMVQRGFEKLKLHRKRSDDLNIWVCEVKGPRKAGKEVKGYLIDDISMFFSQCPFENPFLKLIKQ
jgi:integrating conjugative element relaxase (TIGR03760 family)